MIKYIKSNDAHSSAVTDELVMEVEKMLRDEGIWADAVYDQRSKLAYEINGE